MTMRFATGTDKFIFVLAIIGMTIFGASRPLFSVLFGRTSRGVSTAENKAGAAGDDQPKTWEAPVTMIAVGFIAGTFRFMQVAFLELFADSIAYKIKLEYFKATLRKDSTWFDAHNPNEMGTKIRKECQLI